MKNISLALAMGAALLATSATAARNYGQAGCGLGSLAMGKDGNQILAATTNDTFGSQTFGITSGTSNCTADGAIAQAKQAEAFAEANYSALFRQMASGKGEHLTGFVSLAGCKATPAVFMRAQAWNGAIFQTEKTTPAQVVKNFRSIMSGDPATAALCRG
jgi:hypothetical protein